MRSEANAPWTCAKSKPAKFTCTHPGPLEPGAEARLQVDFGLRADTGAKEIENCAAVKGSAEASCATIPLGARPFEMNLAADGQSEGIDRQPLQASPPKAWPEAQRALWIELAKQSRTHAQVRGLERTEFKRRFAITPKTHQGGVLTFEDRARDALRAHVATRVENHIASSESLVSAADVAAHFERDDVLRRVRSLAGDDGPLGRCAWVRPRQH